MNKYGLIGKNIEYSLSKDIYDYLSNKYNINMEYNILNCNKLINNELKGLTGYNITTPYKNDIIKHLKSLNPSAKYFNSVNCVYNNKGYNFDIYGFVYTLKKLNIKLNKINRIVILGNGNMGKMIYKYFKYYNKKVIIVSRTNRNYSEIYGDIVINSSLIGHGKYENDIILDEKYVKKFKYVIDLNYNPNISKLLLFAKKNEIPNINGLYMLIYQAIMAFNLWHNFNLNIEKEVESIKLYLNSKLKGNCFIGMPFSGKSTLIKKINGIDLDEYIMMREKKTIKQIFEQDGEKHFRFLEYKYLEELINKNKKNIALGGGIINNFNTLLLLKNYNIYYLDVPLEILLKRYKIDENRPLLKNKKDLIKLYNIRKNKYKFYQNIKINI